MQSSLQWLSLLANDLYFAFITFITSDLKFELSGLNNLYRHAPMASKCFCELIVPWRRRRPKCHPLTRSACRRSLVKSLFKGLNSEGWQLSPSPGWSCNQVCLAVGLSCSEAEQHAHNADVSSTSGIQSIMNTMGKTCGAFNTHWGTALDVPGIKANDECFTSSPSRTASEYSCSRAQQHMYRLCYCSSQD